MAHSKHSEVKQVVHEMQEKLRPAPPPVSFKVDKHHTFAVDTKNEVIHIPEWHNAPDMWPYIHEYVVHEYNHTRMCGIPYTYIEGKRLEAAIMAGLKDPYGGGASLPRGAAASLLNTIGDIVNDAYIHGQKFQGITFNIQAAQEAWIKRFPPTGRDPRTTGTMPSATSPAAAQISSGGSPQISTYYILNLLYQHFVGGNILVDSAITHKSDFKKLVKVVKGLIAQARTNPATKDTQLVVEAAKLLWDLSDHNAGNGGCMMPRPANESELGELAQFAIEYGLEIGEFIDLTENPSLSRPKAEKLLQQARRVKSAEMIYKSQIGFKDFVGGAGEAIYAPSTRHFRPSDRDLTIESVALYPNDPRRWRKPTKYVLMQVPTKYEKELGFKKIIGIIDNSGSTSDLFNGRMVFLHELDVLASLCGFAMDNQLPMDAYIFNSILIPLHGRPTAILAQAMEYSPDGGTSLWKPLEAIHNEKNCLVVIITDGEVSNNDVEKIAKLTANNKVIGMVVDKNAASNALATTPVKGFTLYTATPGSGQRIIFSELKKALM